VVRSAGRIGGAGAQRTVHSATSENTFGNLLRNARREANLTQLVLAERAGLSVRTIEHLEGGRGPSFAHSAVQLADALGMTGSERHAFLATANRANRPRPVPRLSAPNNLPKPLTAFIGRERELEHIHRLLNDTRLLTLTDSGGIGKTRLALEVSRGLVDTPVDGITWIELASVMDDALLPRLSPLLSIFPSSQTARLLTS
jgi:transcriptional regulator with XRE-family HTH domain